MQEINHARQESSAQSSETPPDMSRAGSLPRFRFRIGRCEP